MTQFYYGKHFKHIVRVIMHIVLSCLSALENVLIKAQEGAKDVS